MVRIIIKIHRIIRRSLCGHKRTRKGVLLLLILIYLFNNLLLEATRPRYLKSKAETCTTLFIVIFIRYNSHEDVNEVTLRDLKNSLIDHAQNTEIYIRKEKFSKNLPEDVRNFIFQDSLAEIQCNSMWGYSDETQQTVDCKKDEIDPTNWKFCKIPDSFVSNNQLRDRDLLKDYCEPNIITWWQLDKTRCDMTASNWVKYAKFIENTFVYPDSQEHHPILEQITSWQILGYLVEKEIFPESNNKTVPSINLKIPPTTISSEKASPIEPHPIPPPPTFTGSFLQNSLSQSKTKSIGTYYQQSLNLNNYFKPTTNTKSYRNEPIFRSSSLRLSDTVTHVPASSIANNNKHPILAHDQNSDSLLDIILKSKTLKPAIPQHTVHDSLLTNHEFEAMLHSIYPEYFNTRMDFTTAKPRVAEEIEFEDEIDEFANTLEPSLSLGKQTNGIPRSVDENSELSVSTKININYSTILPTEGDSIVTANSHIRSILASVSSSVSTINKISTVTRPIFSKSPITRGYPTTVDFSTILPIEDLHQDGASGTESTPKKNINPSKQRTDFSTLIPFYSNEMEGSGHVETDLNSSNEVPWAATATSETTMQTEVSTKATIAPLLTTHIKNTLSQTLNSTTVPIVTTTTTTTANTTVTGTFQSSSVYELSAHQTLPSVTKISHVTPATTTISGKTYSELPVTSTTQKSDTGGYTPPPPLELQGSALFTSEFSTPQTTLEFSDVTSLNLKYQDFTSPTQEFLDVHTVVPKLQNGILPISELPDLSSPRPNAPSTISELEYVASETSEHLKIILTTLELPVITLDTPDLQDVTSSIAEPRDVTTAIPNKDFTSTTLKFQEVSSAMLEVQGVTSPTLGQGDIVLDITSATTVLSGVTSTEPVISSTSAPPPLVIPDPQDITSVTPELQDITTDAQDHQDVPSYTLGLQGAILLTPEFQDVISSTPDPEDGISFTSELQDFTSTTLVPPNGISSFPELQDVLVTPDLLNGITVVPNLQDVTSVTPELKGATSAPTGLQDVILATAEPENITLITPETLDATSVTPGQFSDVTKTNLAVTSITSQQGVTLASTDLQGVTSVAPDLLDGTLVTPEQLTYVPPDSTDLRDIISVIPKVEDVNSVTSVPQGVTFATPVFQDVTSVFPYPQDGTSVPPVLKDITSRHQDVTTSTPNLQDASNTPDTRDQDVVMVTAEFSGVLSATPRLQDVTSKMYFRNITSVTPEHQFSVNTVNQHFTSSTQKHQNVSSVTPKLQYFTSVTAVHPNVTSVKPKLDVIPTPAHQNVTSVIDLRDATSVTPELQVATTTQSAIQGVSSITPELEDASSSTPVFTHVISTTPEHRNDTTDSPSLRDVTFFTPELLHVTPATPIQDVTTTTPKLSDLTSPTQQLQKFTSVNPKLQVVSLATTELQDVTSSKSELLQFTPATPEQQGIITDSPGLQDVTLTTEQLQNVIFSTAEPLDVTPPAVILQDDTSVNPKLQVVSLATTELQDVTSSKSELLHVTPATPGQQDIITDSPGIQDVTLTTEQLQNVIFSTAEPLDVTSPAVILQDDTSVNPKLQVVSLATTELQDVTSSKSELLHVTPATPGQQDIITDSPGIQDVTLTTEQLQNVIFSTAELLDVTPPAVILHDDTTTTFKLSDLTSPTQQLQDLTSVTPGFQFVTPSNAEYQDVTSATPELKEVTEPTLELPSVIPTLPQLKNITLPNKLDTKVISDTTFHSTSQNTKAENNNDQDVEKHIVMSALMGKIFIYEIPETWKVEMREETMNVSFEQGLQLIEPKQDNVETNTKWLVFNEKRSALMGVPLGLKHLSVCQIRLLLKRNFRVIDTILLHITLVRMPVGSEKTYFRTELRILNKERSTMDDLISTLVIEFYISISEVLQVETFDDVTILDLRKYSDASTKEDESLSVEWCVDAEDARQKAIQGWRQFAFETAGSKNVSGSMNTTVVTAMVKSDELFLNQMEENKDDPVVTALLPVLICLLIVSTACLFVGLSRKCKPSKGQYDVNERENSEFYFPMRPTVLEYDNYDEEHADIILPPSTYRQSSPYYGQSTIEFIDEENDDFSPITLNFGSARRY